MDSNEFLAKVDKDGPVVRTGIGACWLWTGTRDASTGYGKARVLTEQGAHRAAWVITHGQRPPRHVLHLCDNRGCVRPMHLFPGDDLINAWDRENKGRGNQARGERAGKAKLTEAQVREIRLRISQGEHSGTLGPAYGVRPRQIRMIATGANWGHLK